MQYLNVPFAEKDDAKRLGARWSGEEKKWYVPHGVDYKLFTQWQIEESDGSGEQQFQERQRPQRATTTAYVPRELIPLFVDLVPQTAWFSNFRSELKPAEWEAVKKKTFSLAQHHCEACAGQGERWPVECHERWVYDDEACVQTLVRTIALCPNCHEATHFGLARVNGRAYQAKQHLMQVTGMDTNEAETHIGDAMLDFQSRNKKQWTMNARWLLNFVPLSDETREKIIDHNKGIIPREITQNQEAIRRRGI